MITPRDEIKNLIFKCNENINGWNVGTCFDSYISDFHKLYELKKKWTKDEIIQELDISNNTASQLIKNLETFKLLKVSDVIELKTFDYDEVMNKDIEEHMKDIIINKTYTKATKQDLSFILTNCILYAYKNEIINDDDIKAIKGTKGNLSPYFVNRNLTRGTSLFVNIATDEIVINILKDLNGVNEKSKLCENTKIEYEAKPLEVNIECINNRDQRLQAKFRKELIEESKRNDVEGCWICGMHNFETLQAAHIVEHKIGGFNSNNGLLLCPNHHVKLDKKYFKIDRTGELLFTNKGATNFEKNFIGAEKLKSCFLNPSRIEHLEKL